MMLRNSISNTKKFFRKTFLSFKSFFSGAEPYQKLNQNPPYNPSSFTTAGVGMNPQTRYEDLEKFYADFTDWWDSGNGKAKSRSKKKKVSTSTGEQEGNKASFTQFTAQTREDIDQKQENYLDSKSKREARSFSVARKLKELEMMEMSNVDHVLDIEEVLHYYSRLKCPAYLDIVDKFFMDLYAEFLGPLDSPRSVKSRPKFRSVRA